MLIHILNKYLFFIYTINEILVFIKYVIMFSILYWILNCGILIGFSIVSYKCSILLFTPIEQLKKIHFKISAISPREIRMKKKISPHNSIPVIPLKFSLGSFTASTFKSSQLTFTFYLENSIKQILSIGFVVN